MCLAMYEVNVLLVMVQCVCSLQCLMDNQLASLDMLHPLPQGGSSELIQPSHLITQHPTQIKVPQHLLESGIGGLHQAPLHLNQHQPGLELGVGPSQPTLTSGLEQALVRLLLLSEDNIMSVSNADDKYGKPLPQLLHQQLM